jgi:esterase/lipase superfamily enzyme
MDVDAGPVKIQIIAADPESTSNEALELEAEQIKKAFRSKGLEPIFNFFVGLNRSRVRDEIERFNPDIIHFSSAGSPNNKIRMLSTDGWVRNVTGKTLSKILFPGTFRPKCVFLNNSRVYGHIHDIRKSGVFVVSVIYHIGGVDVTKPVTSAFYNALGRLKSFEDAFIRMKHDLSRKFPNEFSSSFYKDMPDTRPRISVREDFEYLLGVDVAEAEEKFSKQAAGFEPSSEPMGPRVYRVWYGTNREPIDPSNINKGYGPDRSSVVHYGFCDVVIPKFHDIGSVGEPWWKRFPLFWRNNRLKVSRTELLQIEDYWKEIHELFSSIPSDDRSLLIFLHGYNVTFDEAATRAAQLGFDLSVRGVTAFFSWPSKGSIKGYAADCASIEASEEDIANFISNMASSSGAEKIHLIAHSMGNRGLLRAFSSAISSASKKMKTQLNQIFLAAPDVDVDLFKRLSHVYVAASERTTMYVSSKDKALLSSGIIHDFPRAGFSPPITIVTGIDTIEVSKIDLTFLGHSYIGDARALLGDMHTLMESNTSPKKRFGLEEMLDENGFMYWQIKS